MISNFQETLNYIYSFLIFSIKANIHLDKANNICIDYKKIYVFTFHLVGAKKKWCIVLAVI